MQASKDAGTVSTRAARARRSTRARRSMRCRDTDIHLDIRSTRANRENSSRRKEAHHRKRRAGGDSRERTVADRAGAGRTAPWLHGPRGGVSLHAVRPAPGPGFVAPGEYACAPAGRVQISQFAWPGRRAPSCGAEEPVPGRESAVRRKMDCSERLRNWRGLPKLRASTQPRKCSRATGRTFSIHPSSL